MTAGTGRSGGRGEQGMQKDKPKRVHGKTVEIYQVLLMRFCKWFLANRDTTPLYITGPVKN
jgi:hypothetical protein